MVDKRDSDTLHQQSYDMVPPVPDNSSNSLITASNPFAHDIDISQCVYSTDIAIRCHELIRNNEDAMQRYVADTAPDQSQRAVADYIQPNGCYKTSASPTKEPPVAPTSPTPSTADKVYTSDDFQQHRMNSGDVYFTLKGTDPAETGLFYFSMEDSSYLPFEDETIMKLTLSEIKPLLSTLVPAPALTDAELYDIDDPLQRALYETSSKSPVKRRQHTLGTNIFDSLSLSLNPTDEEIYGPAELTPPHHSHGAVDATSTPAFLTDPFAANPSEVTMADVGGATISGFEPLIAADEIKIENLDPMSSMSAPLAQVEDGLPIKTEIKSEDVDEVKYEPNSECYESSEIKEEPLDHLAPMPAPKVHITSALPPREVFENKVFI